jgi:hypothetical protein
VSLEQPEAAGHLVTLSVDWARRLHGFVLGSVEDLNLAMSDEQLAQTVRGLKACTRDLAPPSPYP